jgi:hypothetical protein
MNLQNGPTQQTPVLVLLLLLHAVLAMMMMMIKYGSFGSVAVCSASSSRFSGVLNSHSIPKPKGMIHVRRSPEKEPDHSSLFTLHYSIRERLLGCSQGRLYIYTSLLYAHPARSRQKPRQITKDRI